MAEFQPGDVVVLHYSGHGVRLTDDDGDEGAGHSFGYSLEQHHDCDRSQPDGEGGDVGLVEIAHDGADITEVEAAIDIDAEEVGKLARDDQDPGAEHISGKDRSGEEVGNLA